MPSILITLFLCWMPFQPTEQLGLEGYDPVTYFTEEAPQKGSWKFSYNYENKTWLFVSAENKELFQQSPSNYAPQYDGWCGWAMSFGRKTAGIPTLYSIVDGKLYLMCSEEALEKWNSDPQGFIQRADENWKES